MPQRPKARLLLEASDAHQEHADVIGASFLVCFRNKALDHLIRILLAGQHLRYPLIGDHVGQTVRGQDELISVLDRAGVQIGSGFRVDADGASDEVGRGVSPGVLGSD